MRLVFFLSRTAIALAKLAVSIGALPGEALRALDPAEGWHDR